MQAVVAPAFVHLGIHVVALIVGAETLRPVQRAECPLRTGEHLMLDGYPGEGAGVEVVQPDQRAAAAAVCPRQRRPVDTHPYSIVRSPSVGARAALTENSEEQGKR